MCVTADCSHVEASLAHQFSYSSHYLWMSYKIHTWDSMTSISIFQDFAIFSQSCSFYDSIMTWTWTWSTSSLIHQDERNEPLDRVVFSFLLNMYSCSLSLQPVCEGRHSHTCSYTWFWLVCHTHQRLIWKSQFYASAWVLFDPPHCVHSHDVVSFSCQHHTTHTQRLVTH
jgi:hypothetical protein